ncbi:MAG: AAA family ATPase [Calditrichaeota bacterium]|nr:AAA family ATPase [Calditrichota bacterium]
MKFYNRETELDQLETTFNLSGNTSQMTIITGRRRIGKTRLILKATENKPFLYFFISRKSEPLLCEEFTEEINKKLNTKIFGKIERFTDVFAFVIEQSRQKQLVLVIDEIQEFLRINPSVFSDLQRIWDQMKNKTHLHLIFCGSVYSMMKKIFEHSKEPLFGRADQRIYLQPFNPRVLTEIYQESNKQFQTKDFLAFYTITGGVPKYVEYFVDRKIFSFRKMINEIFSVNSIFLEEGKNVLIEEFGKEYTTYFSILALIASSKTSRSEIESILGKNVGGFLERLENEFEIIKKVKPVFSKPSGRVQKYFIDDHFLSFWFRFIYKYYSALEIGNFDYLKKIVFRDFGSYSGKFLEKYFKDKLALSGKYNIIGSYWEKGNQNEIDIVAINETEKTALIAEVKLNKERASLQALQQKAVRLLNHLNSFQIKYQIFSPEDMFEEI